MSEESTQETAEEVVETASEASQEAPDTGADPDSTPVEDLHLMAASAFDADGVSSGGESPEHDSDWETEALKKIEEARAGDEVVEEEKEAPKDEETDPETDKQQPNDSSEQAPKEGESKDSEEQPPENTIKVKTKEGLIDVTLDELREQHPEILQRIKNDISGEREIAKRFSELDVEKKAFNSEKEEIESYINKFAETTREGNILGGLTYFAEFAKIPPYLLKEQLMASLKPEYDKRAAMTQDEINNVRLREENEYLVKKNESDQKAREAEQTQLAAEYAAQELQDHINSIRETHQITDEEWEQAYDLVDKELPPEVEEIPLTAIEDRVLNLRQENLNTQRLESLVKPIEDKVNARFVSELKELIQNNPQLTDQDLQIVVDDSLKLHREKELKDNLEKKKLSQPKRVVANNQSYSLKQLQDLVEWD